MLHPDEFEINEAWIAFRLNEVPITTKADGDFNVIALTQITGLGLTDTDKARIQKSSAPLYPRHAYYE